MAPNFNDNDLVLATKILKEIKVNDVVVLDIPKFGVVLKRVQFLNDDEIGVIGDNKEYKSPIYEMKLYKNNIVGKVLYKF
tara:strand:- start:2324 stop:2563 length:240 start_codon:yes stop_codon:yes gene_type:complete